MSSKRVKLSKDPMMTYLVMEESDYDFKLECLGWIWKSDDWVEASKEDIETLPTATSVAIELTKMD